MLKMPDFWNDDRHILTKLLSPFGYCYGEIVRSYLKKNGFKVSIPVFSIGNFTVGGSGKTPTAIALAKKLQVWGKRPFFLTRGYGGREKGPLLVSEQHKAADVGDEALLLAKIAPTIVSKNRKNGTILALQQQASCIIMDDGLQNPSLIKDFSCAVIDGYFGLGNGLCMPAGPLRAPLNATLPLVNAALIIGEDRHNITSKFENVVPVFLGEISVKSEIIEQIEGKNIVAFCGIGRPEKFFNTLRQLPVFIKQTHSFADHYVFNEKDAEILLKCAKAQNAQLVTTEKDYVRLGDGRFCKELAEKSIKILISLEIEDGFYELCQDILRSSFKLSSTACGVE